MVSPAKASPPERAGAFAKAALLLAVTVGLDQLTKHTVATSQAARDGRSVFLGVRLVQVHNHGVAFGFLSGGGTIVLVVTFAALAGLLVYFALRPRRPWLWVPTGLLVGGAIGNVIDRLAHGAVTDFIKLPLWPAFNFADVAITFGVLALLWVLEGSPDESS
ncbi:MAG: signal peptidase II [Actinomycetota bacterium]|nr:signal peptidase II [Actinomycetota bacterium]